MLCQECQQNPANVHITKITNGQKTEMHLCEVCAQKKEELDFSFEPQFSLQNLFGSLLHDGLLGTREKISTSKLQCPNCGLTFAQFSQIGRLGCSECFTAFGDKLHLLLRRIHGSSSHTGKIPGRTGGEVKFKRELASLKEQLQEEVERENFERAAVLRDQIREMERKLGGGGPVG
ncbi:MAG TPA: hypothetical protein GX693_07605 [Firmicutes bacterium]|nr:hypothetical protein [Bacillota bacterium]